MCVCVKFVGRPNLDRLRKLYWSQLFFNKDTKRNVIISCEFFNNQFQFEIKQTTFRFVHFLIF